MSRNRQVIPLVCFLLAWAIAGCSITPPPTPTPTTPHTPTPTRTPIPAPTAAPTLSPTAVVTDSEIISVIHENLRAMQEEDLEAYMATMHPQSPIYASTEQQMSQLLDLYGVRCELEHVEVIEKSDDVARVKTVAITRKVSGPAFRDNKSTLIHILRTYDGKWKIYESIIQSIEFLD